MEKYDLLECGHPRMFDHHSGHFQTRNGGIYRSISVFEAKLCALISIRPLDRAFLLSWWIG
jgi:hypothetical protein